MRPMIRRTVNCAIVLAIFMLLRSDPSARPADRSHRSRAVHALFNLDAPNTGPFPSDWFTVEDPTHYTGRRVNMPLPDCSARVSDCEDLDVINTLDGFNLQPRVSIPFDREIDPSSATSDTIFLISLGSTLGNDWGGRVVGINQVVWDPSTKTLHVESDELLEQHTRYATIVTRGLRDKSGAPVEATEAFRRFRHTVRGEYKHALVEAVHAARRLGVGERDIVVASIFTTQSTTAVMEKIRDQIKAATPDPADFDLVADGSRTVFARNAVSSITFHQQTGDNPPSFGDVSVPIGLLDVVPNSIGAIAFGKYLSPDYEMHPGEFIPAVGTRTGTPVVRGHNEIYFNLFLPSGSTPPGGWPVALHGTGANGSKQRDLYLVATLAQHGIATIIINSVGRGFGPLSTLTVLQQGGQSVTFSAGGRGINQNTDHVIGDQEGQNATPPRAIIANRDAQRQTVVDYMQLVRIIEVGIDVDGDARPDLDATRISYFGWSFGANYGATFLALEPNVRSGALYSPGGPVFENTRLSPVNRSGGFASVLATHTPSLINEATNTPGIAMLDSVLVGLSTPPRFFNENMPLRDRNTLTVGLTNGTTHTIQSPVINDVAGANAIQEYVEKWDWVNQSANQVGYARHIRKDPLAGVPAKSVLILFGKGDQQIENPAATAMLRAGDLADRATYFLNDKAVGENPAVRVPKNPHAFVNGIADSIPLVAAIARGAQKQIALFLASDGTEIIHPEPALFFEVPIVLPLPETLNFIK